MDTLSVAATPSGILRLRASVVAQDDVAGKGCFSAPIKMTRQGGTVALHSGCRERVTSGLRSDVKGRLPGWREGLVGVRCSDAGEDGWR